MLKTSDDEGKGRGVSPSPGQRGRKRHDRSVRVNVLANRKGGGRVGAMAQGPDGKYAVGGGMGVFDMLLIGIVRTAGNC